MKLENEFLKLIGN